MAQTISGIMQSKVITSLDTYNHTSANGGSYFVSCYVTDIPPSGIVMTIQKNSSTVATATVLSPLQQVLQLSQNIACVANDVISVVLSSAIPLDATPNTFKGILTIRLGT